MIFAEYDEERLREIDRKDAQKKGFQKGFQEGEEKGFKEGEARGKAETVDSIMNKMNFSLEQACDIAGITTEEYNKAKGIKS